MGKLNDIKTAVDIAEVVINAGIALADARRRALEERRKREAEDKATELAKTEAPKA